MPKETVEHQLTRTAARYFLAETLGVPMSKTTILGKVNGHKVDVMATHDSQVYVVECGSTHRSKLKLLHDAKCVVYLWHIGESAPEKWEPKYDTSMFKMGQKQMGQICPISNGT